MNHSNSTFLLHKVPRVIIVVVQVGAVKIYVAAVEAQWRRSGGAWEKGKRG